MNKPTQDPSLAYPQARPNDECESAKILVNEGLIDEAKKLLFRVLANHPNYAPAKKLLNEIGELELKEIFKLSSHASSRSAVEDVDQLIQSLDQDLGLGLKPTQQDNAQSVFIPISGLSPQEHLDLAIAYLEMGCVSDALRELQKAEKRIRTENTFLGKTGLMVVSLIAQCLLQLGKAYEAKEFLQPVLMESDLNHEDKLLLYYEMGCIEQELGNKKDAKEWFQNVIKIDPLFKDASYRLKLLVQKP